MLVPRRFYALAAGALSLLLPTRGGGSDAPRPARLDEASVAAGAGDAEAIARAPDPPLWSPGHGPLARFHPSTRPRELLLSFDDGPDLMGTRMVLDELDRRGLKAIFFVTGWRVGGALPGDLARRALLRKVAAHGHLVA